MVEPGTQQAFDPQCLLLERGLCQGILAPSGGQGGFLDGKSRECSWACQGSEDSVREGPGSAASGPCLLLPLLSVLSLAGPLLLCSLRSRCCSPATGAPFCSSLLQLTAASVFCTFRSLPGSPFPGVFPPADVLFLGSIIRI